MGGAIGRGAPRVACRSFSHLGAKDDPRGSTQLSRRRVDTPARERARRSGSEPRVELCAARRFGRPVSRAGADPGAASRRCGRHREARHRDARVRRRRGPQSSRRERPEALGHRQAGARPAPCRSQARARHRSRRGERGVGRVPATAERRRARARPARDLGERAGRTAAGLVSGVARGGARRGARSPGRRREGRLGSEGGGTEGRARSDVSGRVLGVGAPVDRTARARAIRSRPRSRPTSGSRGADSMRCSRTSEARASARRCERGTHPGTRRRSPTKRRQPQ